MKSFEQILIAIFLLSVIELQDTWSKASQEKILTAAEIEEVFSEFKQHYKTIDNETIFNLATNRMTLREMRDLILSIE